MYKSFADLETKEIKCFAATADKQEKPYVFIFFPEKINFPVSENKFSHTRNKVKINFHHKKQGENFSEIII